MAWYVNKINKWMNEMHEYWDIYYDHRHVLCVMCIQSMWGFGLASSLLAMHTGVLGGWDTQFKGDLAKCWMLNYAVQQQHTQKCIKYEILIKFTEVNTSPINILFKRNFLNYYFDSDPYHFIPLLKSTLFCCLDNGEKKNPVGY